jgi:hypothetical protein
MGLLGIVAAVLLLCLLLAVFVLAGPSLVRLARNGLEDVLHPRPGFVVEIGGRKLTGRVLPIGRLRELTAAGAFASADAMAELANGSSMPREEQADHLERLILLAAAGLRRTPRWVARRCTALEVAKVVAGVLRASAPPPPEKKAEGPSGPPA